MGIEANFVRLHDLNITLWKLIRNLYLSDTLTHAYLMYDLIYDLERTEAVFAIRSGEVIAYLLCWKGPRVYGLHLWGIKGLFIELLNLGGECLNYSRLYIQLYNDDLSCVRELAVYLNDLGFDVKVSRYLDMVTDEYKFRSYGGERARRLGIEDLDEFIRLKTVQGTIINKDLARELISMWRYYGLFINGRLVSITCRYIALPDIWIIGDVFTHPDFRGKGYAKIVTSAITRDAVASGAKALLHVREDNIPAIRVYKRLGYEVIRRRLWIHAIKEN
ncbi:MAG: hypothetical protein B6U85_01255 [Desulfurococcales archaeon ex4484_42]|nr:MAG: hypothetical protein B6U85_01255 [Desulfurococcales archaeon ex4484_42]